MTTALPKLEGFEEHYGIQVSTIGEDGDLVALGHHDKRKTIAAFNRYCRKAMGLANMADNHRATYGDMVGPLSTWHAVLTFKPECGDEWWMKVRSEPEPGSFPVMYWSC